MTSTTVIYLIVSGSLSAHHAPDLIRQLAPLKLPIYTFLTDGAYRLISPWELARQPGHRLVESYFDPLLEGERPVGLTIVAPATFNTVNKISQGIADTLAHSLVAEAIGGGWPVIVAPAVNQPLANHPQFRQSLQTLKSWGVAVVTGDDDQMALTAEIVSIAKNVLSNA